jgi:hypothetical protein
MLLMTAGSYVQWKPEHAQATNSLTQWTELKGLDYYLQSCPTLDLVLTSMAGIAITEGEWILAPVGERLPIRPHRYTERSKSRLMNGGDLRCETSSQGDYRGLSQTF